MADHMRRNDKLQALTADASRSRARMAQESDAERPSRQQETQAGDARGSASRASSDRVRQTSNRQRPSANAQSITLTDFFKQNVVGILSVFAVAVLVVLLIVFLRACGPGEEEKTDQVEDFATVGYVSRYDWTKLQNTEGRLAYVDDGRVKSRLGIDVSDNQHEIDWDAVAADGIDFAMIRLGYRGSTEGELYLDSMFWTNLNGAKNAGLDCGLYFFSQAVTVQEAEEEAQFVLDNLGDVALEYPIAFDSEVIESLGVTRTASLDNVEMTTIAEAFCYQIEQAGYSCMVYGNDSDLSRYDIEILTSRPIWWAEYGPSKPNSHFDVSMWQYASDGAVAGIETVVDMNIDFSHVLE